MKGLIKANVVSQTGQYPSVSDVDDPVDPMLALWPTNTLVQLNLPNIVVAEINGQPKDNIASSNHSSIGQRPK